MDIKFPNDVKKYIELQCNGKLSLYRQMPEFEFIKGELTDIDPKNVLEIGAGIGRASVFLAKKLNWQNTNFYLLDGDSGDKQVNGVNSACKDSFYNSIDATKEFCLTNGISKLHLLNAENDAWQDMNVKFDLCYSFLAIGFHWPMGVYLDTIYDMLTNNALLIFGTRGMDDRFNEFVETQIDSIDGGLYQIEAIKRQPKGVRGSVIILRKV